MFKIDYNLQGMGHLHLSKMKFRHPVPHVFTKRKATYYPQHKQHVDNSSMASTSQVIVIKVHKLMVFGHEQDGICLYLCVDMSGRFK